MNMLLSKISYKNCISENIKGKIAKTAIDQIYEL